MFNFNDNRYYLDNYRTALKAIQRYINDGNIIISSISFIPNERSYRWLTEHKQEIQRAYNIATGGPVTPPLTVPTNLQTVYTPLDQVDLTWDYLDADPDDFIIEKSLTSPVSGFVEIATVPGTQKNYTDFL